jgi:hypothetical protein
MGNLLAMENGCSIYPAEMARSVLTMKRTLKQPAENGMESVRKTLWRRKHDRKESAIAVI